MKKKILGILICGVLVLSITGCGNNETTTSGTSDNVNNQEETIKNEETKKLKVGDYEIKYGYYKSKQVDVLKIMEDGKCTYSVEDCTYYVDGNHIIMETGQTRGRFRVENETTLINDTNGNDIDTLYYYEVD